MKTSLLIMCGLQCSGKSTLTAKLQSSLSLDLVCSDDVRVELLGNPRIAHANPLERYLVYYHTLEAAKEVLNSGQSVIVDATFSKRIFRQSAYFIAGEADASKYVGSKIAAPSSISLSKNVFKFILYQHNCLSSDSDSLVIYNPFFVIGL